MVLDALAELKKYRPLNLENPGPWLDESVANLVTIGIANDLNRIAKNLFKLEQRFEAHAEEILERCNKEVGKDELIRELRHALNEYARKEENLVLALVKLADALDTVRGFIMASGDSAWIAQMDRLRNAAARILLENGLHELGTEKYFTEVLHEAVSAVQDSQRDYREIVDVVQKGYSYMGKILRKAKVVVNTQGKESEADE